MNDKKYLVYLTLSCLAVLAFYPTGTMACMCEPVHPQQSFCNADYVISAIVKRKSRNLFQNQTVHKIQTRRIFKMTPSGSAILKNKLLLTPNSQSLCGIDLKVGTYYIIAGRGPQVNLCTYVKEFNQMSRSEKIAFWRVYKGGCSCKVKTYYNSISIGTGQNGNRCKWLYSDDYKKESFACLPRNVNTTECGWRKIKYIKPKPITTTVSSPIVPYADNTDRRNLY